MDDLLPMPSWVVMKGMAPSKWRLAMGARSTTKGDSSLCTAFKLSNLCPLFRDTTMTLLAEQPWATCHWPSGEANSHSCSRPCTLTAYNLYTHSGNDADDHTRINIEPQAPAHISIHAYYHSHERLQVADCKHLYGLMKNWLSRAITICMPTALHVAFHVSDMAFENTCIHKSLSPAVHGIHRQQSINVKNIPATRVMLICSNNRSHSCRS